MDRGGDSIRTPWLGHCFFFYIVCVVVRLLRLPFVWGVQPTTVLPVNWILQLLLTVWFPSVAVVSVVVLVELASWLRLVVVFFYLLIACSSLLSLWTIPVSTLLLAS